MNSLPRLIAALIKGIRPKQAAKNLFVFAALIFANRFTDPNAVLRATIGFGLFSLASGAVYLLNDIMDVEQDRLHPRKRLRPIASGELPIPLARAAMVVFGLGSIGAGLALSKMFGITLAIYLIMNIAYCLRLKHQVLLDVFSIALGFVLRTVGGGFIIGAGISHWLLLCTLQLALFLGFLKRRQELVEMGEKAEKTRAILEEYSLPFLDQMITLVAGVSVVCYSVYSIESDTAHLHPHLWLTVPFVIFGICRYLYLVYQKGMGGAPEEVLRTDRSMQVTVLLWFVLSALLLKFDIAGKPLFAWLNS
jgi:4-hydroxybenzoate polyprenyltransferase